MAAGAAALSLFRHWLPCRGSMLEGSLLQGYRSEGYAFSDACLRRMDTGLPFQGPAELGEQTPWASELGAMAIVASAAAWAVVVLGLRWPPGATLLGLLPSLSSTSIAVQIYLVARVPQRNTEESLSGWVLLLPEITGVLALLVAARQPQRDGSHDLRRLVLLAWGTTVFGSVHQLFDYLGMGLWSVANWDLPPGTGVGTVLVLLVTASGVTVWTLRNRGPAPLLHPEGGAAPARTSA